MKRLIFRKYDRKIDTFNIKARLFGAANFGQIFSDNIYPFTSNFLREFKQKNTKEQNRIINKILDSKQLNTIFENQRQLIKKLWTKNIETGYFNITKRFLKINLAQDDKFEVYFTYMKLCAYDAEKKYFFLSIWNSPLYHQNIIAHELLHLIFIKYYKQFCFSKGLSLNQFEHLKEALTFILNIEYKNIIIVKDIGYPDHQKFRKLLSKKWNNEKNFLRLLDYGCEYSKKNFHR